jgi:hypothetical protein
MEVEIGFETYPFILNFLIDRGYGYLICMMDESWILR